MQQVLVSGSAGFIGGYVVAELLERGYAVVGLDNFSKYGKVRKSYDEHPDYRLVEGDAELTRRLMPQGYRARPEQVILFTVATWSANCPQHIPQRFEAADVAAALAERDERIAALEAEIAALKTEIAALKTAPSAAAG